jgi:putative phosphonate catabolism associated alcohol dehydrogenase
MNRPSAARLAVFVGPEKPFEFRSVPLPTPGEGELLVAISLATVCGSDLHTFEGRRTEPTPCVLGHEAVGRVVDVGPGRDPAWVGARVTWTLADSCGCCRPCLEWALPQKCERLFKYGHASIDSGSGLNGCYASHLVLRAGTTVIRLPDRVTDAMAAPANCALATMVSATEPLARGGGVVLVQGAGLLGIYACALLRKMGWQRVLVVDPNPARLETARAFGGEPLLPSRLDGICPGSVDAAIEVAGSPSVVGEGMRLLRPGAHYSLVGMVHPDSRLDLTGESIIRKCLTIQGTHNYAPRHLERAVEFLTTHSGDLPWESLVSPAFPLTGLEAAFQLARSGRWPRVAVDPRISEDPVVAEL